VGWMATTGSFGYCGWSVSLWDLQQRRTKWELHEGGLTVPSCSPSGKTIVFRTETSSGRSAGSTGGFSGRLPGGIQFDLNPFGLPVPAASTATSPKCDVYDGATGKLKWTFSNYDHVAISPDDKLMAGVSHDGYVSFFDATSGERRDESYGPLAAAADKAFYSPDGKTLATPCASGVVRVWDMDTGKLLATLEGSDRGVPVLTFSPDGNMLAVVNGEDNANVEDKANVMGKKKLRLWDLKKQELKWERSINQVNDVCFTPDCKMLVVGDHIQSEQGVEAHFVTAWDLGTANKKWCVPGSSAFALSPDGRMVVTGTGTASGAFKLLDTTSGKGLVTFMTLSWKEYELAIPKWIVFTPEGYYQGSDDIGDYVQWRIGNEVSLLKEHATTHYRPGLVKKALAGGH